jgi:heterodisulfide reductase subunit B
MRKLSLFTGCLIPNRYPGIEKATMLVLERIGIKCSELKEAACCPAPGIYRSFDKITWLTLASRNLVLAEEKGTDILTICNGCFSSLMDANNILKTDAGLRNEVNAHLQKIGKEYRGTIEVRHIIEFLHTDIGVNKLGDAIEKPLEIRAAVHYGCHLLKPTRERKLGSAQFPVFFDELVEATGAKSVPYEGKTSCCGAGGGVRSAMPETSFKMTEYKLDRIQKAGGQIELEKSGKDYDIPVLHFTQLLGLALGFTPDELGLHLNEIVNLKFEEKIAQIQKWY